MKNILNKYAFLVLALLASSCLNDELSLDPKNSTNVIEFKNPGSFASPSGSTYSLYAAAFDFADEVPYPVSVSYSGANVAPENITVSIGINEAAMQQYNEEQDKEFSLLPTSFYTMGSTELTILKGERTAVIDLKIKSSLLPFDKSYVLPLQIKSASSGIVSGNFETILINVIPKNAFDGIYRYQTSANTSLIPNADRTATLETINGTDSKLLPGLLANYSNAVSYSVDPETNHVTVTCPSLGVQEPQDPRSNWNPSTKVMTVFWKQGNGGRTFEETFTYVGPR